MTFQTTETREKGTRVITLPFKPNAAQDEFIHSGAPKTMFVASVAAGKTTALCMRAWMVSYKYPGNKGMIARYTYDEIRDTIIPTWKKCVPRELMLNPDCLDRKDIGMQTLLIHSQDPERPSEILFRNLEDPHTYESAELGWFALSQANDPKITRRMWDTLNERLRWNVPYHFAFAEANWGGNASKGGWIWDEFENTKQGHLVVADTMVNWDNLPDDYKVRLANLPKYRQLHSIYGTASGWDPLIDIRGIPVYPEFKFGFHTPEDGSVGDVRGLFTQDRPVIRGIDVPGPGACVWCQMDEKGRLLVGHELALDSAIGTAEFADIVQSDSAQFFPGSKYLDYVDPAALRVEQTSGKSNAHVLYEKGLRPRPAAVQIEKRLQCVKDWLTMAVRGEAGLLIDPGCHRLVGAMQGGYNYPQIGSDSGRYSPVPGKNSFSHVADALQYACHGVARLQYATQREEEAPPMPQAWLGSLRRNFPQPPRGTRPELEVASSRSRRDVRIRLPRIDD